MIIDSSVVVAILLAEPGSDALLRRLLQGDPVGLPAPAVVETGLVLARRLKGDSTQILMDFLAASDVEIVPFSSAHAQAALAANSRFGKGRHPAALNFGDCMVYAVAAVASQPLLFAGKDFARTDVLCAI